MKSYSVINQCVIKINEMDKIKQLCLFVLVNKRLDEWVAEERLDTRKVQYPRKDQATTGGVSTPKKVCNYTKINLKIIFNFNNYCSVISC